MQLIGITGKAGCGKSTVAGYLKDEHGYVSVSFATPIKQALSSMFGWSMEAIENREFKENPLLWLGKSPRQLMQTLGTEWGRNEVHMDLWVMLAERTINLLQSNCLPVVVPDVRFENEAKMIRKKGGTIFHIKRYMDSALDNHASEQGVIVDSRDKIILNQGSLTDLFFEVEALFVQHGKSEVAA